MDKRKIPRWMKNSLPDMAKEECPCDKCRLPSLFCSTCVSWKWLYFNKQNWEEITEEDEYE